MRPLVPTPALLNRTSEDRDAARPQETPQRKIDPARDHR